MTTAKRGTSCSQAHGRAGGPPSHFTGKSLHNSRAGLTNSTDTGTTAHIYKWKYLSLTKLWRLVLFLWVGDHLHSSFLKKKPVRSKNLGLSSYTDLRRTLGSCSAEHSGHLPHWQHTEVPASQSSWGRGSFFLAFVPLFQREVSIPLLNAATTEGFIPKIQPPEHWHSYQCSLSNCAALEKVEGRKTPITCQGRHRGPRSDLTANKSYRIIFYQTKQVLNPSVIFGRCLSWQNPREKQRQY